MTQNDRAYERACEDAREDAWLLGINRTQEEVEANAERYRELEEKCSQ